MRRMVESVLQQHGTDMVLTGSGETKTVRGFFRAVNSKSWQSMESEATLLGEITLDSIPTSAPQMAGPERAIPFLWETRITFSAEQSFTIMAMSRSTSGDYAWRRA